MQNQKIQRGMPQLKNDFFFCKSFQSTLFQKKPKKTT